MAERLVICGGLPTSGTGTKDVIALEVNGSEKSPSRVNLNRTSDLGMS